MNITFINTEPMLHGYEIAIQNGAFIFVRFMGFNERLIASGEIK